MKECKGSCTSSEQIWITPPQLMFLSAKRNKSNKNKCKHWLTWNYMGGMKQEKRIVGVSVCCPPSPVPTFMSEFESLLGKIIGFCTGYKDLKQEVKFKERLLNVCGIWAVKGS